MLFEMRYDILVVYSIMYMCSGNYFVLIIVDPNSSMTHWNLTEYAVMINQSTVLFK